MQKIIGMTKSEFIDIVADSFLEEYDELNIEVAFKKAVSISATYALYSRCVDVPEVYFEQDDFLNILSLIQGKPSMPLVQQSTA